LSEPSPTSSSLAVRSSLPDPLGPWWAPLLLSSKGKPELEGSPFMPIKLSRTGPVILILIITVVIIRTTIIIIITIIITIIIIIIIIIIMIMITTLSSSW